MDLGSLSLDPAVEAEFQRWIEIIGTDDPYASDHTIGLSDVLAAHFLIADFFYQEGEGLGGIGPRDVNLLHSALSRQFVGFGDENKWNSIYEIAATCMFGLIKNHPFHDANKRTAFLCVINYLYERNITPTVSHKEFENFTVKIAERRLQRQRRFKQIVKSGEYDAEVVIIADYIRRNTRKIDTRNYTVTYRELNKILSRFDVRLVNPHKNFIDVQKKMKVRTGFLGRKIDYEWKKIAQVGFPSWTKQVSKGDLNKIRKAAGLVPENGIDSQVFFKGLDTRTQLIAVYQDALRRLASR